MSAHIGIGDIGIGAIRLAGCDNVATVLHPVGASATVRVRCGTEITEIIAIEAIPLCHKISLSPIAAGTQIVKYGQPIGRALSAIAAGQHVHVHNMRSDRALSVA